MDRIFHLIFRPSTFIRGFWLFIALLHLVIFARKLISGDWAGLLDQTRLVLLVVAAVYGTVRMWSAAKIFDGSPRRAFSLVLLLIVGHCAFTSSDYGKDARQAFAKIDWTQVIVAAPVLALVAGACGCARSKRPLTSKSVPISIVRTNPGLLFRRVIISANLFQRPPPVIV